MQASGGIHNNNIRTATTSGLNGVEGDCAWVRTLLVTNNCCTNPLAPNVQLLNCGRPKGICSRQHHTLALLLKIASKLSYSGGLSSPIYTYDQNHPRLAVGKPALVFMGSI